MTTGTWPTGPPHPQAAGPAAPPTTQVGLTTLPPTPGTYTNWPSLQAVLHVACLHGAYMGSFHLVMRAAQSTCDVMCSQSCYVLDINKARETDICIVLRFGSPAGMVSW